MNERIKELMNQTGVPTSIPFDQWCEKFAELIVRECADVAKHHVMNISTYADADFVDEQIREHFGVEE